MVNQTLISFKCDNDQLALLDATCVKLGMERNTLLNFLVYHSNFIFDDLVKFRYLQAYSIGRTELP